HEVGPACLQESDRFPAARTGGHFVSGSPREPADHVQDALLVVDHHQQWLLIRHTHSFETALSAARSARRSNGGVRIALASCRQPLERSSSSVLVMRTSAVTSAATPRSTRDAGSSPASSAGSMNAASNRPVFSCAAASAPSATATLC